jgi:bacteriocin-like protein
MATPKKDQDKPESKKPASIKTEIKKGQVELSDDDLKKVTGGSKKPLTIGW